MTDPVVRCEYCYQPAIGYSPCRDVGDVPALIGIFLVPPALEALCLKCAKRIEDHWEAMNKRHGK